MFANKNSVKMHEAYECVPILNKLPLQIESIAAYEDSFLLGTKQGHLLVYRMVMNVTNKSKPEVELVRSNKAFAKKPITQIKVVPEVSILIILSDNVITVHDLNQFNFPIITQLHRTKGAALFSLDVQKQETLTREIQYAIRLCVAVKRKLQLYYWKNRDFLELTNDLGVSDTPRVMSWCGESLCVGFKTEYCLIKISGELKELFPTGKQPEPVICRLNSDKLALGKDEQTIIIDSDGSPTLKYAVPWTEIPIALEYDKPYLLAILPSYVEVRTSEPKLFIQKIPLSRVKFITYAKKGCIFVASSTDVWCLYEVDLQVQITKLIEEKQFELALQLSGIVDHSDIEKQKLLQRIQNMYAFDLFCQKNFRDATNIFLKLGTDPSQVIGLFPDLLPEGYRNTLKYPAVPPVLQIPELERGLAALVEYLLEVRNILIKDLSAPLPLTAIVEGQKTVRSNKQLLQIIDTTLLKCYLQVNHALVASLLRLPHNSCHVDESERALKRHHRYSELIILYQCKGLHKKALELLAKQAKKNESQLKGRERTIQYLQHLGSENLDLILEFSEWVLVDSPEEGLKIFIEDLPEIESLPRQQVLQHLTEKVPNTVIQYLEHVIFNWNDTTFLAHNTLIRKYCDRIQELKTLLCSPPPMDENVDSFALYSDELGLLRRKLQKFLEKSTNYSTETFPSLLLNGGLYEEAAIVMDHLGRYEDALAIYTQYLNNGQNAEDYCIKVYNKDKPERQDIFLLLLKAYLSPFSLSVNFSKAVSKGEPYSSSDISSALKVLREHSLKIDPERALELLPSSIKVQEIHHFLESVLQEKFIGHHNIRIVKSLYLGEHLQVYSQKIKSQSLKVTLTDMDVCWVCQKRIGKSAFARFPSAVIVHYSCKDKYLYAPSNSNQ